MTQHGLEELPNYVTDPEASAADDAEAERAINALPAADLFALAAFAGERDAAAIEGHEEAMNRLALVRPPVPWRVLLPVALLSLAIIALAWR